MKNIDEMFAFLGIDDDGEGIVGFKGPRGWMPMVGADMARVESFREMAQEVANLSGRRIVVAKFSIREDIETIEPYAAGGLPDNIMIVDAEEALALEDACTCGHVKGSHAVAKDRCNTIDCNCTSFTKA